MQESRAAWRRLRRRPSSPWIQVEIVAALIVGWNLVVGVLFELGEQFRFRAVTDPITMSIAVLARLAHGRPRPPVNVLLYQNWSRDEPADPAVARPFRSTESGDVRSARHQPRRRRPALHVAHTSPTTHGAPREVAASW